MQKARNHIAALAACAAVAIAAGFPAAAQETIKIGVITDRVGVAKPWSEPIMQGTIYAAKQVNAKAACWARRWSS